MNLSKTSLVNQNCWLHLNLPECQTHVIIRVDHRADYASGVICLAWTAGLDKDIAAFSGCVILTWTYDHVHKTWKISNLQRANCKGPCAIQENQTRLLQLKVSCIGYISI